MIPHLVGLVFGRAHRLNVAGKPRSHDRGFFVFRLPGSCRKWETVNFKNRSVLLAHK